MSPLKDLFYRRVEVGVSEHEGQKYRKFAKVPLLRRRHFRVAGWMILALASTFLLMRVIRHYAETPPPPPPEAVVGSQYQP